MTEVAQQTVNDKTAIRPFHVNVPEAELTELRRRINATKWPERETVADTSQGVQLATIQKLARYWATDYDWRKCEAKLKALPHFITEIDGLDIHFIHVRSKHENALPLIVTHGWPGSIIEQLKIIDPLTNPTAHGGERVGRLPSRDSVDAWLRVLGQADRDRAGTPIRIARAWVVLMKRLGYTEYVAQGGDWGALIVDRWVYRRLRDCSASTPTWLARFRPKSTRRPWPAAPPPPDLSADEKKAYRTARLFLQIRPGLRTGNGEPPADTVRHRRFTSRPGRLDARP